MVKLMTLLFSYILMIGLAFADGHEAAEVSWQIPLKFRLFLTPYFFA